ncbi:MAG TPA: hypothetical protein VFX42_01020 [Gemmatimonadales bacterium]|jgi:hypothetical protein|nr:hypothetical protein [Gemmatimonadales bacterium]
MVICQWHLDIVYGKQAEALRVMRAWGAEKLASSEFRRVRGTRLLAGFVGASASHLVDEYAFESLADFEAALAGMVAPQFRAHSEALAPFIVPGSQHWVVYRVLDQS